VKEKNFTGKKLVVVNHHTELDWLISTELADRAGLLGGSRALAKKSLQWVPILGWSSIMSGDIFLSRSWEKDKLHVETKIDSLEEQPSPIWMHIFPEGTRLNAAKHKASLEFAESRGLPRLEHHLIPRTKGFSLITAHMEGTVLDLTIVQGDGAAPTLPSLLMGHKVDARIFVREMSMSSVPKDVEESGQWLIQLFKGKDEIKSAFLARDWDKLDKLGDFKPRNHPRRTWPMVWVLLSNVLVLGPLFLLVLQGGPSTWAVAVLVLAVAWAFLHQMVNASKIKKTE